jgi:eukaryotic-like serine/threonine-protein kinase
MRAQNAEGPVRYGAFLSYSHADERHARWLLQRLEGYRVPKRLIGTAGRHGPVPARLGPVFRDRDELHAAGDLGSTITAALADSAALVVVCSPAAARSRWVNAEADAFRASGRSNRIFCFVVDGDPTGRDPGEVCFPPALLAPDVEGGPPREPLAADARPEGDGRDRAFLRLVAGLLGVGYDDLAQREAQRRQRRLAAIAAGSLAVTTVALGLAAAAWVARNDAERRQAQAEDILGFMLGDLREKLGPVGRLDLMRAVDDKAIDYFATLDPRDLTDRALEEQARSLVGIGEVRFSEGNHDAALAAFREAHARSTTLYQRDPGSGQRLFDLAQAQYWIGFVAFEQGRLEETETWFGRYRDSGQRLAALDPGNFSWQRELGYGYHNLAVLEDARGRYAEAERQMLAEFELYRAWVAQRPDDRLLRSEMSDVSSWLGSLALRQGRLEESEAHFAEQNEVLRMLVAEDPRNARWKEQRHDALLLLADVQAQRGRLDEAHATVEAAAEIGAALAVQDPSNNYWRLTSGRSRYWQALLAADSRPATAAAIAADATAMLAAAREAESKSERVLAWLVRSRNLEGRLALDRGDLPAARAHVEATRALIEPAWRESSSELLRPPLAQTLLLQGEVAARAGEAAAVTAAWTEARRLLEDGAGSELPFARLDPLVRVLQYLGHVSEAEQHLQRLDRSGYVPMQPFPARG